MTGPIDPLPVTPKATGQRHDVYVPLDATSSPSASGGAEVVLSASAYRAHLYAMSDSVIEGSPGAVALGYPAAHALSDEVVRELIAADLGERTDEGYRLRDGTGLETVTAIFEHAGRVAADCLTGTGHVPDPADPTICGLCHGPVERQPRWRLP